MIQADRTMHSRVKLAIKDDLVNSLNRKISEFTPVAQGLPQNCQIGDIEDAKVLIQNSLWLNVPIGQLASHKQVTSLQDRTNWAWNQLEQIELIRTKFDQIASYITSVCV